MKLVSVILLLCFLGYASAALDFSGILKPIEDVASLFKFPFLRPPKTTPTPNPKPTKPPFKFPFIPFRTSAPPTESTLLPTKATEPLTKVTPSIATPPPTQATPPPTEATPPPTEATPPPTEATPPPTEATPPPTEASSPPTESTLPPTEPTITEATRPTTKATTPSSTTISSTAVTPPIIPISTKSTTKLPSLKDPNNPCAPFRKPHMPDFRAPGRRISEMKCYEYVWELKIRSDMAGLENECRELRARGMDNRIIGGIPTVSGDFPNMGAIGWKAVVGSWKFMCGCTLISHKFVLTAAHCSSASDRDTTIADVVPKIVRLGDTYIMDATGDNGRPAFDAEISRIINHPQYKSPKQYFDIALMELKRKVEFTMYIQPACLWTKDNITAYGDQAEITGWGVVESGTLKTSPVLQKAEVDIIDSAKCNRLLRLSCNRNWCGLQDHQLCAGKIAGGADACQGDSGGPLQAKIQLPVLDQGTMHYVLGVTSFGVGCALPGLPGVYTRVSSFVDWIEGIVWPDVKPFRDADEDTSDLERFARSASFEYF